MEALTGVTVALLTVYDRGKDMDKGLEITESAAAQKIGRQKR